MPSRSTLLSATLGRIAARYRTLDEWAETYREIIATLDVTEKTKQNRRCSLQRILGYFAGRTISTIKPHEIAAMIQEIKREHPQCAKRTLIETKALFTAAINYGWIHRSPAAAIKAPAVKVQRRRLSLDHWCAIAAYAETHLPPWVPRMMLLALVTGQRRSDLRKMRFGDVWGDLLHVQQEKTGTRIALPLSLKLDVLGVSLGDVIADCRDYAAEPDYLLRKHNGTPLVHASLSARFEEAREGSGIAAGPGSPPSLHECRSLSERLYRSQGINTMLLLGHATQRMTDLYNDDRGLTAGEWKTLAI